MGEKYKVKQEEDLIEIAYRLGFGTTEKFRSENENKALLALRVDGVLKPGDELIVPERKPLKKKVSTSKTHRIVLKIPKRKLILRVVDENNEPMANAEYMLEGSGVSVSGTTDGNGMVNEEIPARDCKEIKLSIGERELSLAVATMDPATSVTGAQVRMSNLGYPVGARDDQFGPVSRGSIKQFQKDNALEPSGKIDEPTREKLREVHGS